MTEDGRRERNGSSTGSRDFAEQSTSGLLYDVGYRGMLDLSFRRNDIEAFLDLPDFA
jgi:hypothetical protein